MSTDTPENNINACCAPRCSSTAAHAWCSGATDGLGTTYDKRLPPQEDSNVLLTQSIEAFKENSKFYFDDISIDARTRFKDDDRDDFSSAAAGKASVVGVKVITMSVVFADGLPVPLRLANTIDEVLTAEGNVRREVFRFKHCNYV